MGKLNVGEWNKTTPISGYVIENHRDVWESNDRIDRPKCTLFGRPAQQAFTAFFVWEKLLGPLEFKRFVEVGTGFGNTSVFFMLHCIQKGAMFVTHERMANRSTNSSPLKELLDLKSCCVVGDVYGPTISQGIMELVGRPGRTVMFLDGGDKPHEFSLFVPALKAGDIVAVHDWGRAIKRPWVEHIIELKGLQPVLEEDNIKLETLTRMWEVTK
jgi:hypothetical protein